MGVKKLKMCLVLVSWKSVHLFSTAVSLIMQLGWHSWSETYYDVGGICTYRIHACIWRIPHIKDISLRGRECSFFRAVETIGIATECHRDRLINHLQEIQVVKFHFSPPLYNTDDAIHTARTQIRFGIVYSLYSFFFLFLLLCDVRYS